MILALMLAACRQSPPHQLAGKSDTVPLTVTVTYDTVEEPARAYVAQVKPLPHTHYKDSATAQGGGEPYGKYIDGKQAALLFYRVHGVDTTVTTTVDSVAFYNRYMNATRGLLYRMP